MSRKFKARLTLLMDFIMNPLHFGAYVLDKRLSKYFSNETYLRLRYFFLLGKRLKLNPPTSYNEKCQWLKLHCHRPEFTIMADKVKVKEMVANLIGEEYVIPLLGAWDHFDDIDFEKLPNQFVLKCNHDSGSIKIIKDKNALTQQELVRMKDYFEKSLSVNYFLKAREWPYKDIEKKILAEPYIESLGKVDSIEYKLSCMNGEVKVITVCEGIAHAGLNERTNDHYDKNWTRQNWYVNYKPSNKNWTKPVFMDSIVAMSEKLSKDVPFVRVDWYVIEGKIYFGEFTFYSWGGFCPFVPEEWNNILGSWIKLPEDK